MALNIYYVCISIRHVIPAPVETVDNAQASTRVRGRALEY